MISIKFYLDEDINVRRAVALRNKGFDAITTLEAKRLKTPYPQQLDYATQNERVIVTWGVKETIGKIKRILRMSVLKTLRICF